MLCPDEIKWEGMCSCSGDRDPSKCWCGQSLYFPVASPSQYEICAKNIVKFSSPHEFNDKISYKIPCEC